MAAALPKHKHDSPKPQGLRQAMSGLHIWSGLLVGWLLYAMFLTGTVSFFRDELSTWMRPELIAGGQPDAATVAQKMVDGLSDQAATSVQWIVHMPTARKALVQAYWLQGADMRRGFEQAIFDPASGQRWLGRDTSGGDFFYNFHFNLHYLPKVWGRWIAGLCAMFMLVAMVSGVITHKKIFVDFFTFRWGKGQRSWLDAHNGLSVLGLPFHFMITYSGLITLMALYMPWGMQYGLTAPQQKMAVMHAQFAYIPPAPAVATTAKMAPIAPMIELAEQRWGVGEVGQFLVNNPGRANAQLLLARGHSSRISFSPQFLLFDAVSGALLREVAAHGPATQTRGVLYALHLGRFADSVTRWLYFLVSLGGTAMVGTGLVLWTVKRRQRLHADQPAGSGLRLVERLNIAAIAGLSLAMAAFLWANRLLPSSLPDRANWEIHVFFLSWGLAAVYVCGRSTRHAWSELLGLSALLLALLPVLNACSTERGLLTSLAAGDWVFASVDLTLLAFAALHATLALRSAAAGSRNDQRLPSKQPAARQTETAASVNEQGYR